MKKYLGLIITDVFLVLGVIAFIILNAIFGDLYYPLGFMCGITTVAIVITIIKIKAKDEPKPEYDERQLKARGECFQISFFALIVMLILDGFIRQSLEYDWSSYLLGVSITMIASVTIFCVLAIIKDAYIGIGKNMLKFGILMLVIGIVNVVLGILSGFEEGFLVNGMVNEYSLNLAVGGMCLVIGITSIIKNALNKKEELIEK
ncbi:MAG: hypothetical protein IJY14_00915 [Acholeplasmatales bacterium]|nr:hypothetical protein [Acholeplasmatales bacterium]